MKNNQILNLSPEFFKTTFQGVIFYIEKTNKPYFREIPYFYTVFSWQTVSLKSDLRFICHQRQVSSYSEGTQRH